MKIESTTAVEARQSDVETADVPPTVALDHEEYSNGAHSIIHIPSAEDISCTSHSIDLSDYISKHSSEPLSAQAAKPEITLRAPVESGVLNYTNLKKNTEEVFNSSGRTSGLTEKTFDTTSSQTDPFAFREGRTFTWNNVDMTLVSV